MSHPPALPRSPAARPAAALVALVPLLAALVGGCAARRTIRIESEPPGAKVRLDAAVVGSTPVEVPFEHYGTRRVTLYEEGYRTWSSLLTVRAPWYFVFPVDFVTEILLPFGWKDRRTLRVPLVPEQGEMVAPDLADVLEHAEAFRRAGPEGPTVEMGRHLETLKQGETITGEKP